MVISMKFPSKEIVERIRREYPQGTRVELVQMDDAQAPPVGTKGTVVGVDDTASLLVRWDNGSHLNVVYGEDVVKKAVAAVRTVCYGKTEEWDSREEAEQFFFRAMTCSEGSEQSRYVKIYTELKMGLELCTDGEEF